MSKCLAANTQVRRSSPRDKVYCHEPYAQELYDIYSGAIGPSHKDVSPGDVVQAIRFVSCDGQTLVLEGHAFTTIYIDVARERRYFEMIGTDPESFAAHLRDVRLAGPTVVPVRVLIESADPFLSGSLLMAHADSLRDEMLSGAASDTAVYSCRLTEKNTGGFMVDIQGVRAFLPGGQAAANVIKDFDAFFDSMRGKEIRVMVEDYIRDADTIVVSHKKYLRHVLPDRASELDMSRRYTGTVTGATDFGIFVEFPSSVPDEIFTGLLHITEMSEETKERMQSDRPRPGDRWEFFIKGVTTQTRDGMPRIVLADRDPAEKAREMEAIRERYEGRVFPCRVVWVRAYGALMEIEEGRRGLMPPYDVRRMWPRVEPGKTSRALVSRVDTETGKIFLRAPGQERRERRDERAHAEQQ